MNEQTSLPEKPSKLALFFLYSLCIFMWLGVIGYIPGLEFIHEALAWIVGSVFVYGIILAIFVAVIGFLLRA